MDIIKEELKKLGLVNTELLTLKIDLHDNPAYAVKVSPSNKDQIWEHFHTIKDATGLTPLLIATWSTSKNWKSSILEEDLFMRFPFEGSNQSLDLSPKSIIDRSMTADFKDILEEHCDNYSDEIEDSIEYTLERLNDLYGEHPDEKEIRKLLAENSINNYFEFEQWIYTWQQKFHTQETIKKADTSHLNWFEPQDQNEALLLLPITNSYEALAFVHWYGAECSSESCISMLSHWHEQYGAEVVAHYGTMLHVKVKSRPQTFEEAFTLACEQEAFAPCTTALPGISLYEHANALLNIDKWFLHERP